MSSLALLEGLERAPVVVVCDGCRPQSGLEPSHAARLADRLAIHPCRFSKRGIVTDSVAAAYSEYKQRLLAEAAASDAQRSIRLLELPVM